MYRSITLYVSFIAKPPIYVVLAGLLFFGRSLDAQELVMDDQIAESVGQSIIFNIEVRNTPNEMDAFGFDILFDPDVLTFIGLTAAQPISNWSFFDSNVLGPGALRIGGFTSEEVMPAGFSAKVIEINFALLEVVDSVLIISNAVDDVHDWSIRHGAVILPAQTNGTPQPINDSASTREGAEVVIDVLANDADPDGDVLTVAFVSPPTNGASVNNDDAVTYIPNNGFSGIDSFDYTVTDGTATADALVIVTVTPANSPPIATNDTASTDQDRSIVIDVLANDRDLDDDKITVAMVTQPASGVSQNNVTTVTYVPNKSFAGVVTFEYTITDGEATDVANVTVDVVERPDNTSNGPCFIATAAYGSYLDEHVFALRRFRDNWLITNALGRSFVATYYSVSPPIADLIARHSVLRLLVRLGLTPIVYFIKYPVLIGVSILGFILLIKIRRRRRRSLS